MRWKWVKNSLRVYARFPSPTPIVLRDLDLDQVSLSAQLVQLLFVAEGVPRSTFWQVDCSLESKWSEDLCCEDCHSSRCQNLNVSQRQRALKWDHGNNPAVREKTKINRSYHEFRCILGEWDGFLFKLSLSDGCWGCETLVQENFQHPPPGFDYPHFFPRRNRCCVPLFL